MLTKTSFSLALCGAVLSLWMTDQAFASAKGKSSPDTTSSSDDSAASSSMSSSSSMDAHVQGVWVTRPDGGQQCAPKSGQSLESSADELQKSGVRVLSSQKGSDKKMHAQMCGIPSGKTNMFQIRKEDLSKAIALGFHEVKDGP